MFYTALLCAKPFVLPKTTPPTPSKRMPMLTKETKETVGVAPTISFVSLRAIQLA